MTHEELLAQLEALAEKAELEANAYKVLRERLDEIAKALDDIQALYTQG